jgi:hypothetical protein
MRRVSYRNRNCRIVIKFHHVNDQMAGTCNQDNITRNEPNQLKWEKTRPYGEERLFNSADCGRVQLSGDRGPLKHVRVITKAPHRPPRSISQQRARSRTVGHRKFRNDLEVHDRIDCSAPDAGRNNVHPLKKRKKLQAINHLR